MTDENLLAVRLEHRQGSLYIVVNFCLRTPWTVMFGPSGSGKSTVLRTIAGFVRPDRGLVFSGPMEKVLIDTTGGVFLAPHLRPVRSAGQTARLFPQMRVRENVAYGLGWQLTDDAKGVLDEVLRLFHLSTLAERWPTELSGGERQRASVARAVASAITFDGPGRALLLLDEPFSGLDAALRDELALALRELLGRWKVPVLSVSHDVSEAFLLGAEVIRMAEGKIVGQGPVGVVLREERERLLAGLR